MENYVMIAILAAAVVAGIVHTIRHFRGRGGCCGSGDYKVRRKRLKKVRFRKIFVVEGMHCAQCAARVEEAINDIEGVACRADYKNGKITVAYAEEVEDARIRARIERIGYRMPGGEDARPAEKG